MSLGKNAGSGQPVEQGRLAGIGVADEGHRRIRHILALGPMKPPGSTDLLQLTAQLGHFLVEQATVGLDLGFTWTGQKAPTAPLAFQVGPGPHQPRAFIGQTRQLDLQHTFLGARPLAEDFQDQPSPVDDLHIPGFFQVPLLDR